MISLKKSETAMFSASANESATDCCFLDLHEIGVLLNRVICPDMDLRVSTIELRMGRGDAVATRHNSYVLGSSARAELGPSDLNGFKFKPAPTTQCRGKRQNLSVP